MVGLRYCLLSLSTLLRQFLFINLFLKLEERLDCSYIKIRNCSESHSCIYQCQHLATNLGKIQWHSSLPHQLTFTAFTSRHSMPSFNTLHLWTILDQTLTVIIQIYMNRIANNESYQPSDQITRSSLDQAGVEMKLRGREEEIVPKQERRSQKKLSAKKGSASKNAVQVVQDVSGRQVVGQHNPEDQPQSKEKASLLQRFSELTRNRWFWIVFGTVLFTTILTVVLVLNFVVFVPQTSVVSVSQTAMPLTGETIITKTVAIKDVQLFSKTKEFSSLVGYVEVPKTGRLMQESSMPAKLEISHQEMGVTVVGWSPNDFEIRVNPDKILAYFEASAQRRLQTSDRLNNSFSYDDGASLETAIQQLIIDVVSSATERSSDQIKLIYQEKFIGVFDEKSGKYKIKEKSQSSRLLLSFNHLLEPVKQLMSDYLFNTVKDMKKYGNQIAEAAGAVYRSDTILTYPGENQLMDDLTLADLDMTRVLQEQPQDYVYQMVSKQAYDNFAVCTGPKQRRVCDKEGFLNSDRGQPVESWPSNPEVSASYSVSSKNSLYAAVN